MKDMKIAEVKKKAAVLRVQQDLEKRKKVHEIMSSIEKIDEVDVTKLAGEKKGDLKEEAFPGMGTSLHKQNLDQLYESDPVSRWKIALVVLGIFLVVLLYLKFAATGFAMGGDILFVLYGDYGNEHSGDVYAKISELKEIYGDKFVFVYKHVPLTQEGLRAAEAVECAGDQGRFLPYHQLLYSDTVDKAFSRSTLLLGATEVSLNVKLFEKCLDSGVKKSLIMKERRKALQAGVDAVPTVVLQNQKKLVGTFSVDEYVKEINLLVDGQDLNES